jgi:ribosome-binding protein aMBF1 (putative translation factor)
MRRAPNRPDVSDGVERGKYRMKRSTKNKGKLSDDPDDGLVPIESTAFWKAMQQNRVGNLLAGARLKAGMTQAQLAQALGIRQNMISDYERGRRVYSAAMAKRLSRVLHVKEQHLTYGDEPED